VTFTIIISHSAFRDSQFDSIVENETCVVKFYADWCPPCRAISPEFSRLSLEYPKGKFLTVNVDHMRSVSRKNIVHAMPTFIMFENGKETARITGADMRAVHNHVRELFA
jgi:thioredoxin 1